MTVSFGNIFILEFLSGIFARNCLKSKELSTPDCTLTNKFPLTLLSSYPKNNP